MTAGFGKIQSSRITVFPIPSPVSSGFLQEVTFLGDW